MNIVIVGAGEVGYHLADILSREGHRVSVVDPDPLKVDRLTEALDVHGVLGDGTSAEVQTQAGTSKADLVVSVSNHDLVNMLACRVARDLGAKRIILRLKNTLRLGGYRYFYKRSLGFDVVLSTEELATEEVVSIVREQHALEVESFADGRVQLRRFRIREESELTAQPLAAVRLPTGLVVAAMQRKDDFFVPKADEQLVVEDQVYLIGRAADLDRFEVLAGARRTGRRSVVIMGGSGVGAQVAARLDGIPGISVRMLEKDSKRARDLATSLSGDVTVLQGDATDLDLLYEENIGEANIFIASTSDDEDNIVACQLARSLGVERTVALVNKASYRQIYDLLGVDLAVSPRVLCANRIQRFVRSGSVSSICVVAGGRGEVLEVEAWFHGGVTERKIKDLGLPQGTVVGAVVHGETVNVPTGHGVIHEGDQVILFTLPDHIGAVEEIFRNPDDR